MSSSKDKDPLEMGGLDPELIASHVESNKKKPTKETEMMKEERLKMKEQRLTAKSAPPPPPPTVVPVQEVVVDKSALLDKLTAYRERFPHLKKRNNVSVKSSAEDIEDELHYCEVQLGSKQDGSVGSMILHSTMVVVETVHRDVWNPLGLNLNGLGKVTKDNMEEFQPIVDELMIKYGAGMYISAEVRLALAMGAMVMTVHAANSGDPRIASALEKMNQKVPVVASAKDL
jgi:predicted house-cleaning NTP pyrophosphatase (Maf/HAM1 superfamily)